MMRSKWASQGCAAGEALTQTVLYSRRATPRAEADDDVYTFWYCGGRADLSHVRNLNLGGIFIETPIQTSLGSSVELYFLVGEGQIRAKGVVRHAEPGNGLGLKFTALHDQDRLHFGALMKRLYSARSAVKPPATSVETMRNSGSLSSSELSA
jgi:PilZ domain